VNTDSLVNKLNYCIVGAAGWGAVNVGTVDGVIKYAHGSAAGAGENGGSAYLLDRTSTNKKP
jgi:hypothetical protein